MYEPTREEIEALEDFKREMIDNVIPEIIRALERRQMLAAESRRRPLLTAKLEEGGA